MKKLINLTLHKQGPREVELAAKYGYELDPEPRGVLVQPGPEGLLNAAAELANRLSEAAARGEAVLIGGHTGALVFALRILERDRWPEMVCFETERIRDQNDRFVFVPRGIYRIPAREPIGDTVACPKCGYEFDVIAEPGL